MLRRSAPAVIISANCLLRGGLASLLSRSGCRVVGSYSSVEDAIKLAPVEDGECMLVIICANTLSEVLGEVADFRAFSKSSKIVVLANFVASDEFKNILKSTIQGAISLETSLHVLLHLIDLIANSDARIVTLDVPVQNPLRGSDRKDVADKALMPIGVLVDSLALCARSDEEVVELRAPDQAITSDIDPDGGGRVQGIQ